MTTDYIPQHTLDELKRYIDFGYMPGGFLTSVLTNDLIGAVTGADADNIKVIPNIVKWCQMNLPAYAWGSPQAVKLHSTMRRKELSAPDTET